MFFPLSSSFQSVDFDAVAVTVKELVTYALKINSSNHSWLIIQADIYFGEWIFFKILSVLVAYNLCTKSVPSLQTLLYYFFFFPSATHQFSAALNYYLQAGAVSSDFFTKQVPPDVYTDQVSLVYKYPFWSQETKFRFTVYHSLLQDGSLTDSSVIGSV